MPEIKLTIRGQNTSNLRKMFRALGTGPKRQSEIAKAMLSRTLSRSRINCPDSYGNGIIQNHLKIGTIRRIDDPIYGVRYALTTFGRAYGRQVLGQDL